MEFIYSESVPIRKVDNTPLSEDEFYKVLNLAHEAIQCARKQREEVLASCAALRARIAVLEKVVEAAHKHRVTVILSIHDASEMLSRKEMDDICLTDEALKAALDAAKEG
jgi:hypothetical protein